MAKKQVAVALSGGVDSSAAAFLLQQAGYEVTGIAVRLWSEEKAAAGTRHPLWSSAQNIYDAEQICLTLGIPFHLIDLGNEFKQYVVDYFCREYTQGRTPNPCIACNQHIKFGFLLEHALSLGVNYLSTGHYVKLEHLDETYHLHKGIDSSKDQSYVLYTLGQDKLAHLLFPLGDYTKAEVIKLARQRGLPAASSPSSQDICFISTDYSTFLRQHFTIAPGDIVDRQGEVVGKHEGAPLYTIGQRHGLGLTAATPLYVTKIEPDTNRITVGSEKDLCSSRLIAGKVNWISGKLPPEPITVSVKIRYRSPEVTAVLYPKPESAEIRFHQPQRAVTPGQAVVFYQDSEVLGGGTIEN